MAGDGQKAGAMRGVAAAAAAEEVGRYAASDPRVEAAETILSPDGDTRPSLAPLESWEVFKLREIDNAITDFDGMPEIQAIFAEYRDSIVETARGRRGEILRIVTAHTVRFDDGMRQRIRRSIFAPRRRLEEEEL